MKIDSKFLLLQINDTAFPIGAYSHSGGLETYVQKDLVSNSDQTLDYLYNRLKYALLYNELLAVKLSYNYAARHSFEKLENLERIYSASRTPREIREAEIKMGNRFIKTLTKLSIDYDDDIFTEYIKTHKNISHPIAYGLFCYASGIDYTDAINNYLYAQSSQIVNNCVKSIPLSQTEGQELLVQCQEFFTEILEELENLGEDDLCLSMPGFDIRSMQHECLYSRLYMS